MDPIPSTSRGLDIETKSPEFLSHSILQSDECNNNVCHNKQPYRVLSHYACGSTVNNDTNLCINQQDWSQTAFLALGHSQNPLQTNNYGIGKTNTV
jgi:hypothetical protein